MDVLLVSTLDARGGGDAGGPGSTNTFHLSEGDGLAGLEGGVDVATFPRHGSVVLSQLPTDGIRRVVAEIVVTNSTSSV